MVGQGVARLFDLGENDIKPRCITVVGIGDVNALCVRVEVLEESDASSLLPAMGQPTEIAKVVAIEGNHKVPFVEPSWIELARLVSAGVATALEGGTSTSVSWIPNMPPTGPGAVDQHDLVESGRPQLLAEHEFGHGGSTNVSHAHKDDAVGHNRHGDSAERLRQRFKVSRGVMPFVSIADSVRDF